MAGSSEYIVFPTAWKKGRVLGQKKGTFDAWNSQKGHFR